MGYFYAGVFNINNSTQADQIFEEICNGKIIRKCWCSEVNNVTDHQHDPLRFIFCTGDVLCNFKQAKFAYLEFTFCIFHGKVKTFYFLRRKFIHGIR